MARQRSNLRFAAKGLAVGCRDLDRHVIVPVTAEVQEGLRRPIPDRKDASLEDCEAPDSRLELRWGRPRQHLVFPVAAMRGASLRLRRENAIKAGEGATGRKRESQ